ncbi:MAG: tRNA (adenosine(37)-N6)-threonylcarbamoyltransferase complex ATPase subunit type 1 TsaE [Verrucomicrobia bacterium]|jgi:tRNA threonylcarbamoyladenosine biosynthesis protein TsaE|nr:tRNA (adenosine(37)-N6)-threonylcarbamoyltransferase complex ATPase subunit type 1 TsaE [Verrucomicrobiota bacterium]
MNTQITISDSVESTQALAENITPMLPPGALLALHGDLGSGKTCFVTGIARALGIQDPITSPTFTMINEYMGSRQLCHMDLYRIADPDELFSLGLEDYIDGDGITIMEWAERAGDLLPEDTIHILFEVLDTPDTRRITINPQETQQ